jgi:hypothetical protein bfra3_16228|nr:MAG TPA: chaperone protein [Caudoviricetes sp.]
MKRNVTKDPKIALCRACHGTGTVHETVEHSSRLFGRKKTETVETTCPQCGGSGRVTVSANIELDIRPYHPKIQEE